MAVKGVFASNQNIVGARKGDFASGLLQTQPTGKSPLLALSTGMPSIDARDTIVHWFEENHLTGRVSITNNASTGTTFTVSTSDSAAIVAGNIYMVEASGEYVFVSAVSAATLTVERGFGGTTVTATDGSSVVKPMQLIQSAFEEGSARPTAVANLGFPRFNFLGIYRNSWDVTRTARQIDFYTGDLIAKNKSDAALFHAEALERSAIWGKKAMGIYNNKPFRVMDGLVAQIKTNIKAQASTTKWDDIQDFLQSIFEVNIKGQPNERIGFCGNTVLRVIDKIARLDGRIEINPGATEWGFKVTNLMTPIGDITLMTHPLFTENPVFTKSLLVLHPGAIKWHWLSRTFDDNYDKDGSRAGVDADYGVITSECCITLAAEKTSGYYTGIDTAAVTT